ncbi:SdrD B-like domain-containing protein [Nonlabens sp. Asnod3-H03]|uniref:SdrD B-like domain-containing protein n=1 Tax=Nonlabens sp. Asnod3-H03 TaxID=3160580 RepID=UPI00386E3C0E
MKNIISNFKTIGLSFLAIMILSCDGDEVCGYTGDNDPDCPNLEANIGDDCDSNGDTILDGTVNEFCECITNEPILPEGCDLKGSLNLSSGIDANGDPIAAAFGAIDPFWKVINQPPLFQGNASNPCTNAAVGTFSNDAYSMNFGAMGSSAWVNQPGTGTLAPFDLGPNGSFGCNNAVNNAGIQVPFVFERSFCVLEDTQVDYNFVFKADDRMYFELVDNNTGAVLDTSATYIWTGTAIPAWSQTNFNLPAGSYSIRGSLINTGAVILGFSFLGDMVTSNGEVVISNNSEECCENNTITVQNVLEEVNCDRMFNAITDSIGDNWVFELLDNSNTVIRTATTDINGNIFFSGLADGTYTVRITNQSGWSQTVTTETRTVIGNTAVITEFYSCRM